VVPEVFFFEQGGHGWKFTRRCNLNEYRHMVAKICRRWVCWETNVRRTLLGVVGRVCTWLQLERRQAHGCQYSPSL